MKKNEKKYNMWVSINYYKVYKTNHSILFHLTYVELKYIATKITNVPS